MGAYVVFEDDPTVHSAQQAIESGRPYWPTVRTGHFGCMACGLGAEGDAALPDVTPGPKPLGPLGVGSVVQLPAGALVRGLEAAGGGTLQLTAPCRFQIGKAVMASSTAATWEPSHTDVLFDKDVLVTAIDAIQAVPVPGGGTFSANPGWHGVVPAGVEFAVVSAGAGSDPRFAAVALPLPVASDSRSLLRLGVIVTIATAIVAAGLFAATLMLGRKKES